MQSTKDKLIVSGLFISIILGLIPVGVNIAHNFDNFALSLLVICFFIPLIAGGLVLMFVFDFIGKLLKLIALLAALGLIEGLPWIAIGFCIALGFTLFHMI